MDRALKVSVFMPYYKRLAQIELTLNSYAYHYSSIKDSYEVIVVEDYKSVRNKEEHAALTEILNKYKEKINIIHLETAFEGNYNPALLYIEATKNASGNIFGLTNPECLHRTNVIGSVLAIDNVEKKYVICSCELGIPLSKEFNENFQYTPICWYQHSVHNNCNYHHCSYISKENYFSFGGFDSNFSKGLGWEDNDFLNNINKHKIPIVLRDDLVTLHQKHEICLTEWHGLYAINAEYYKRKWNM